MDSSYVRAASRRAGVRFKLSALTPRRGYWRHGRPKLTMAMVRQMRAWASRDGWGMPREAQAQHLATVFPVRPRTVAEVLTNMSWRDASYEPGKPDADFWGTVCVTTVVLRVLARTA